ncbi:hypothetical protein KSP40_PGU000115 [Platanthera guangdongensis]|uniref:Prolamin-like domain-containing protein n=1 Tax=Platanthera guangdongensis TaxID=2320717 RepID=A0ABR2MN91_9ASPA
MKAAQVLVLLLISLAMLAAHALREEAKWLPGKWKRPFPGILPSPILLDPELRECWNHLRRPEGCVLSIYESSESDNFLLSKECCDGVRTLSDNCFWRIFTTNPFTQKFAQKVDYYCESGHGASPASAPTL